RLLDRAHLSSSSDRMKMRPVNVAPTAQNSAKMLTNTIPVIRGEELSAIRSRILRAFMAMSDSASAVPNNPPMARWPASLTGKDRVFEGCGIAHAFFQHAANAGE